MAELLQAQLTSRSILDFLYEHRDALHQLGVTKIGLFGSYVRGEQQPESDLDFVFTMNNLTFERWMNVWNFLEDSFGRRVDLVPEKDLRPEIRAEVLAEVQYVEDL